MFLFNNLLVKLNFVLGRPRLVGFGFRRLKAYHSPPTITDLVNELHSPAARATNGATLVPPSS